MLALPYLVVVLDLAQAPSKLGPTTTLVVDKTN